MKPSAAVTVANLAADQWGLVTSRQVADAGLPRNTWHRLVARGDVLERVARGVYRSRFVPPADHVELRAAWLQLAPAVMAWDRRPEQGVVSHRSAASLYGLGHLPALTHDFSVTARKQSQRADVRIHHRTLDPADTSVTAGLPVTRPARIASDLLADIEDPEAVGQVVADAIRAGHERPRAFVPQLAKHSARFGLRRGDGVQLLRWLLDLVDDPDTSTWMADARAAATQPAATRAAIDGHTEDRGVETSLRLAGR